MGADQGVTAEGPAVHHADVQGRVQELILREVLGVGPGSLSSVLAHPSRLVWEDMLLPGLCSSP